MTGGQAVSNCLGGKRLSAFENQPLRIAQFADRARRKLGFVSGSVLPDEAIGFRALAEVEEQQEKDLD